MSLSDPKVIEQFLDTLEQVQELSKDFAREAGKQGARLDNIESSIRELQHLVTTGNGKALLTRMGVAEEQIRKLEMRKIHDSGGHALEKSSDLAQVELRRADARKVMWTTLARLGIGGPGLFAAVKILLDWIGK